MSKEAAPCQLFKLGMLSNDESFPDLDAAAFASKQCHAPDPDGYSPFTHCRASARLAIEGWAEIVEGSCAKVDAEHQLQILQDSNRGLFVDSHYS